VEWPVEDFLELLPERATVEIEGRPVAIRAWRYRIRGVNGGEVPVMLLDTNVDGNSPYDRTLTDHLYGGDTHYRLCQEIVLGIGGVRMLRALEMPPAMRYHMNEGHSALLAIELFTEEMAATPAIARERWSASGAAASSRRTRRFRPGTTSSRWTSRGRCSGRVRWGRSARSVAARTS